MGWRSHRRRLRRWLGCVGLGARCVQEGVAYKGVQGLSKGHELAHGRVILLTSLVDGNQARAAALAGDVTHDARTMAMLRRMPEIQEVLQMPRCAPSSASTPTPRPPDPTLTRLYPNSTPTSTLPPCPNPNPDPQP